MASAKHTVSLELTDDEDRDLSVIAARLSITREEVLRRLLERAVARMVVAWDETATITLSADEFDHLLDELDTSPEPNDEMHRLMSTPSTLER
jgi:uncharacterized protein (DUF1778 family)